jgi:hypothetical protein
VSAEAVEDFLQLDASGVEHLNRTIPGKVGNEVPISNATDRFAFHHAPLFSEALAAVDAYTLGLPGALFRGVGKVVRPSLVVAPALQSHTAL